jgi:hypothetical protein
LFLILHPVSPSAITRVGSGFGNTSECEFTDADFAPEGIANSQAGRNPGGMFGLSVIGRLVPSTRIAGHS